MKYLSDYMEEKQTELFKKTGTIFAFSQKQFEEQRKNNVTYVNLGQGMLTEKPNVEEVINELDKIYKDCIKQDIEENGKEKIILRELENHEAFYVSNTEDTERKLEDYECISKEDIKRVYLENYQKYNNY
ncbi:MAG: hypothetical protein GOVbin3264_30 [Prokaryotic dsDNA virus sp.]|nr:MAG: hypothetical protein GOVbin3264_30 [Prokaryotic dsDNA virus sp.]